ncbi:ATP-binding protein [Haliangium ochraceum]|uniref:sensor histidine kinase n=1 Tax=Haliangium ochraceum TaxID=80816 RepID=UPI001269BDB6|nr:ATP-binding protein [Haliangium ochraceum]
MPGNIQAISALLSSILIVVIGVSVLLRDRTQRTYTSFAAFTIVLSSWHLCSFIATVTDSSTVRWLALWPAATIPPTAVAFFREFLSQPSIGGKRRPPRVTLAWTILACLALIYAGFIPIHETLFFQIPFGVYVFGGLYRCVYDTYKQYRATVKRVERVRVRYVLIGGFLATTFALIDVLPRFGVAWPALGNVFTILYLYFLSQSLFRYQLIDINELIGKMAVLGTLVALLWAVYGLLLAWIGRGQEGLFLLNALVASFVILLLYEPVRSRLENGIHRWLLRQRTELRGRIERLGRELLRVTHVDEMASLILTALEESRRVTHAAVYLLDSAGAGYDRKGYYGTAPIERIESATYSTLLARLRDSDGHYVDADELRAAHEPGREDGEGDRADEIPSFDPDTVGALRRQLESMNAGVVFPMYGSAATEQGPWLLGLLVVRDARTDSAFDRDDLDLFRQLATQAARTIEASEAFTRVKERDRLAAIGELSAGLAHEIRNPLGAIKGAAQLLVGPDGEPAPPSAESVEFVQIIIEEVDRLNNVVSQFLDYARATGSDTHKHRPISMNEVIDKTVQILRRDAPDNVAIRVHVDELLPPVSGDAATLLQVFLNLGQNAIQAMAESGGVLDILTTRRRRSRLGYGSFAEARFRDSGVGIASDVVDKLFIPFFTTREKGTGLGLPISERIVSEHGGTIEVRANPEGGSTFSVFLPALGPSRPPADEPTPPPLPLPWPRPNADGDAASETDGERGRGSE